ncbi:MAG: hypothetical protein LBV17_10625 [Treponema sp.]|nr:hypothetical protein [Treponema sp.]
MKNIVFLFIPILFTACVKKLPEPIVPDKPAEFFLIGQSIERDGLLRISEVYVIANLPKKISEDEILALVEDYNRKTITVDMIKSHYIWRSFYRETEDLTRDYQRGAPYPRPGAEYRYYGDDPGQQIRNHFDDLLIKTSYQQADENSSTLMYWHFYGKKSLERQIPDINSYFANSDSKIVEEGPEFRDLFWKKDGITIEDALIDDDVTLFCEVKNIDDGEMVKFKIFEQGENKDDPIDEVEGEVKDGEVQAAWKIEYKEKENSNTTEEIEEKGWTIPEYFFVADYGGVKSGGSKLLYTKDKLQLPIKNIKMKQGKKLLLLFPNGEQKEIEISEGNSIIDNIPIGEFKAIML